MTIHYALYKNNVVPGATDYVARVISVDSINLGRLADIMVDQGSTITKTDIIAVQTETLKTIHQMLKLGFRINFGDLCSIFPVIKGRFPGVQDLFDPDIHKLEVHTSPGRELRNYFNGQETQLLEKDNAPTNTPDIKTFEDASSRELDTTLTISSVGEVIGSHLKFDRDDLEEGVFLITDSQDDIRANVIQKNTTSTIVFQIPQTLLPNTLYKLEVRIKNANTGKIKKGELAAKLKAVE